MKSYHSDAIKFYKSKLWQKTRESYLSKVLYQCERCSNPASIVHHKHYIDESNITDINILLKEDNLEALCIDCHNKEHFLKSRTKNGLCFNADGELVKTEK